VRKRVSLRLFNPDCEDGNNEINEPVCNEMICDTASGSPLVSVEQQNQDIYTYRLTTWGRYMPTLMTGIDHPS